MAHRLAIDPARLVAFLESRGFVQVVKREERVVVRQGRGIPLLIPVHSPLLASQAAAILHDAGVPAQEARAFLDTELSS